MANVILWDIKRVVAWVRYRTDPNGRGKLLNPDIGQKVPAAVEFEPVDLEAHPGPDSHGEEISVLPTNSFEAKLRSILLREQVPVMHRDRVNGEGHIGRVAYYPRHEIKKVFPGIPGRRRKGFKLSDEEALVPHIIPKMAKSDLPPHLDSHFDRVRERGGAVPTIGDIRVMAGMLRAVDADQLKDATYSSSVGLARVHDWYLGSGHMRARPGRSIGFPELVRSALDLIEHEKLETVVPLSELRAVLFPGRGGARIRGHRRRQDG